jgi:uncharacterized protein YeaO (DUF488 family)
VFLSLLIEGVRDDLRLSPVSRLWPRGISKKEAALHHWTKHIAPSTKLRKWFGHDPARWEEFRRRYARDIHRNTVLFDQLGSFARQGPIALVYSARDDVHNDAIVRRDLLLERSVATAANTEDQERK